jgi:hypothetical protein
LILQIDGLDPATLFSPDTTVTVASATVRYPSAASDGLARAVGQTLAFVRGKGDTIRATVVRVDPPQYRLADGRLLLSPPGEALFPPELVRTAPEASLILDERARGPTPSWPTDPGGHLGGDLPGADRCGGRRGDDRRRRDGDVASIAHGLG